MSHPILSPIEQTLVRAWIKGVPLNALTGELPPHMCYPHQLLELKQRLTLKAKRLGLLGQPFFLEPRQETAVWENKALNYLHWLVDQPDLDPALEHPIEYWLNDAWLPSLRDSGLTTIKTFLTWRQSQGHDWWRWMPGIGQKGAKELDNRMQLLFPEAQRALPAPLLSAIVYQSDLAPLTHFVVPEALNGTQGTFRGVDPCFIAAETDLQAIQCWLARLDPKSHTHRAYQREAERLLLWAILEKHKALSSLDSVDLADYRRFLLNPQPAARWVGKNRHHTSPDWKPFTGPLSSRSLRHADTLLGNLFHFLLTQGYLRYNPFTALPKLRDSAGNAKINVHRALSDTQWIFVTEFIERNITLYTDTEQQRWIRLRLITRMLYATGLRLHELAQATKDDIFTIERDHTRQVWLKVLGKGHKERDVPLSNTIYQLTQETIIQLTHIPWNQLPYSHPIIPPLRQPTNKCLTPKAIYVELKFLFQLAAEALGETNPEAAITLSSATTHWLRHTHGTVAVDKNIPITMIRDNLGHASISTTSQYLHADSDARYDFFTEN